MSIIFFLRMRNISEKAVSEMTVYILCSITYFENHVFYEIILKYMVETDRTQMRVWHMRFACWIPKAANTHSEYVIIISFPLQQCLHKRT
jgi:hypothetical protein